jgi:hypothetical protein
MLVRFTGLLCIVGAALGVAIVSAGRTQEPPPSPDQGVATDNTQTDVQPEGVQVEARGPVHEAFAAPAIRGPRPTPVITKQPPDPIEELPPDQKPEGDNVQWIPGYWAWDDDRNDFIWVSGTYRDVPPGRQWVPGYWNQVEGGWQWAPGYWQDTEQQQAAAAELLPEPPDPIAESPPPAPSSNDVFVPGTWVYRDTRYMWRPGFWWAYRPGWLWVPAHYIWTPAGYIFVEGYWDYPLTRRGLLFAPAYVTPAYLARPGWLYRPSLVVSTDFMLGCMFVRLNFDHYYFGDYFAANYARNGFVSWVDYRIGGTFYDPLLNYFRWQFRGTPNWDRELRRVYIERREGIIPRPPRNFQQQQVLVQNNKFVTINNINRTNNVVNITNITNVAPLATLRQVNKTVVNLRPVSPNQLALERQTVKQFRTLTQERARVQAQLATTGSPLTTKTPVRMELPALKSLQRTAPATVRTPPPPAPPQVRPATQVQEQRRITQPETVPGRPRKPTGEGQTVEPTRPQTEMRRPVTPGGPTPAEERMRQGREPLPGERRPVEPGRPPTDIRQPTPGAAPLPPGSERRNVEQGRPRPPQPGGPPPTTEERLRQGQPPTATERRPVDPGKPPNEIRRPQQPGGPPPAEERMRQVQPPRSPERQMAPEHQPAPQPPRPPDSHNKPGPPPDPAKKPPPKDKPPDK